MSKFLDILVDTACWPFVVVGLFFSGLGQETWHYRYRAWTFFANNPTYVGLIELLHAQENWAGCKWVESVYVDQIRFADADGWKMRKGA